MPTNPTPNVPVH